MTENYEAYKAHNRQHYLNNSLDHIGKLNLSQLEDGNKGDILYFNGTTWAKLSAGTNGYYLKTQGTGNNPVWSEIPTINKHTDLTDKEVLGIIDHADNSITEPKLRINNSPTNGYVLSWNGTGGYMEWIPASTGTVISVSAGAGMNFSTITSSGSVILGTPSTCSGSTPNQATGTTHTHTITGFLTSISGQSHSTLSGLDYSSSGHTGFEPTLTKGNLTAGSSKITIGGSPNNSVIGSGVSIDVNETNLNLNNIGGTLDVTKGGTGLNSCMTGDIIYASGTNIWSKRSIGTEGQVLSVSGGVPVWQNMSTAGSTKEFFVPATGTSDTDGAMSAIYGAYGGIGISQSMYDSKSAGISFFMPYDYNSIISANIIGIFYQNDSSWDLDVILQAGAAGEDYNTHTASNSNSTYNITANKLTSIDITNLFTTAGVSANDYVGVKITNNSSTGRGIILGVRVRYS